MKTSLRLLAVHPHSCLRFCGGVFIALAWLALSAAQAQTTNYALGTTTLLEGPAAGSDSVVFAVTPATGAWTATTNATWLHLSQANQSGTGSTNVIFSFDANPGQTRTGTLTIGNQTLTVTQAGSTYVAVGTLTALVSSGLNQPLGVAVDGAGNVYFANAGSNMIQKWTQASSTVTTLVSSTLSRPSGVAVDGAGNVFFADTASNSIQEWTADNSTVTTLVSSGLNGPFGVAVDGLGNLYIANAFSNTINEWTAANSNLTTLVSGLEDPERVAVDGAGNVYIAGIFNGVEEWMAANSNVTTLILASSASLAVDGAGNVYMTTGNGSYNFVREWMAANNTVTNIATTAVSFPPVPPEGVAVDGAGNVYIADTANNAIKELPHAFVDPTPRLETAAAGNDALQWYYPPRKICSPHSLPPVTSRG